MRKLTVLLALCALAPFALAACDDDEETPTPAPAEEPAAGGGGGGGGGGAETVAVSAVPDNSFAFEQDSLEAAAGSVTFEFDNPATLQHDFCVEDSGGSEVGCSDLVAESSTTLDLDLEAGEYTFYCSVAGHRDGGMEGALTVE
jgi:plastocyanin